MGPSSWTFLAPLRRAGGGWGPVQMGVGVATVPLPKLRIGLTTADPKRLPSEFGYGVVRPAGVDAIPRYSVGQGRGYASSAETWAHDPARSWWRMSLALARTRGPSGRDDLSKAGAISFADSQSTRSRAGQAPHQRAMKRYEQPIKTARMTPGTTIDDLSLMITPPWRRRT
jgi:hypothetical protein